MGSKFFPLPVEIAEECERLKKRSYGGGEDEMIAYRRRINEHPEEFFKVGDILREGIAKVGAKQLANEREKPCGTNSEPQSGTSRAKVS